MKANGLQIHIFWKGRWPKGISSFPPSFFHSNKSKAARSARASGLLAVLAILLAVPGCRHSGPELGVVSGTVTLDGAPLADADVYFDSGHGRPSGGGTDANGVYRLVYTKAREGALLGVQKVRISTRRPTVGGFTPERVPAVYNTQSTLTAEVKPGGNTIDFPLKSR
jgi:hypothetical protein